VYAEHTWYFVFQNWTMKTLYLRPCCSSWRALTQHPHFCDLSVMSWPLIQMYRNVCRRRLIKPCKRMVGSLHMRLSTAWSTWTWLCQVRRDLIHTHIVNADCPLLLFLLDISTHSVYVRVTSLLMLLLAVSFGDITVPAVCTNSACGMNFQIGWYHPTVTPTVNNMEHNWHKQ
jgi:hypothetical protein